MKALASVTLSSATGPEKRIATRGLTLEPSSSLTERISSQPAGSAPQSGSGERDAAPGGLPRIGRSRTERKRVWTSAGGRPRTAEPGASESRARS